MNIALILAGGTGTRLGSEVPKQYIEVGGRPVISYCLKTFVSHPDIDAIQIVADDSWHEYIYSYLIEDDKVRKWKGFSKQGENRQLSILNALTDIRKYASDQDLIMIHDAVRPFLSVEMIEAVFQEAVGHDGVLPVLPMKDTVYFSETGKKISGLLDRNCIFVGQAPEVFRLGKYYEANLALLPDRILQINGSTEPATMAGMDIVMIAGDEGNFKITTQEDLRRFMQKVEESKNQEVVFSC